MFAKLCIYAFFLVAITTITIGAPLEVSSKLTSRRAQLEKYGPPNQSLSRRGPLNKRSHFAQCNDEHEILLFSYCDKMRTMVVNCMLPDGTIDHFTIACEADEICVDYDDKNGSAQALCVQSSNVRKWSNVENKLSCSEDRGYALGSGIDLYTGVTTYDENGDTVEVYELQTFKSDQVVEYNFSKHNITKKIPKYNHEHIKYCFVPGTSDKITAAAVGVDYGNNQQSENDIVPPVLVAPLE